MKKFIMSALALIIVIALFLGVFIILSWLTSILLNVALIQLGLGRISTWGTMCLIGACRVIYNIVIWE